MDDEPGLFVSCCPTHHLRRWGTVDEGRTETADGVASSKEPDRPLIVGRENLAMIRVPQTAAATWKVFRASVCLLFPLVPSLTLFVCIGAVPTARSLRVSATSPEGRHGGILFYFSSFSLEVSLVFCFFWGVRAFFCFVFSLS